ncbi:hypothetical protein [Micrococcus luteus]|uniref:hypothetical protein n=1 Tax=Micrococcus luteus TaxID=1270 RepID=UPI00397F2747
MAVAGQVEGLVEFGFCFGVVRLSGLKSTAQSGEGGADSVLLFLEKVERDRSGVVRLEEFLTLSEELTSLLDEVLAFKAGLRRQDAELFCDRRAEFLDGGWTGLDPGVVADDELLDDVDVHGLTGAVWGLVREEVTYDLWGRVNLSV